MTKKKTWAERLTLMIAAYGIATAQQTPAPAPLPASSYLVLAFPSHVLGLASVFGNRLWKPGQERLVLTGTWTDSNPATLTTEIPNKVKLAIIGTAPKVLLFDRSTASVNRGALGAADQDVLESLAADSEESFLYAFGRTAGSRYLGGRYRTDDGKTAGYTGPYYDIFESAGASVTKAPGGPQHKLFYFDSISNQFVKARYHVQKNGQTVDVQTVYSNWAAANGQFLPGRVERFENGVSVFSFVATAQQLSAGASDGIFSTP